MAPTGNLTVRRWPAYAIAGGVGLFCLVVVSVAAFEQLVQGKPANGDAVVALGATGLRVMTIVVALVAVSRWERRVPARILSMALWAMAIGQLAYPLAETLVKAAILLDLIEPLNKGISNMSATGWFNFAAAWLVWGVPGVLFGLLASDHRRRHALSWLWAPLGGLGGMAALAVLGLVISRL
ncbi:hypothetical protein [Kribbella deserti]|uniref:DUF3995 domain-containing protein n=1 Tax=Kribbella deserti TaxID=1926257 RepID=A0ABV6QET9_9ACTN